MVKEKGRLQEEAAVQWTWKGKRDLLRWRPEPSRRMEDKYMGGLSEGPPITEDYVPVLRIEAYCTVGPYRSKQWSPDPLKWVSIKKSRQCPHGRKGEQEVPELAVLEICLGKEEQKLPCGWTVGIKDGRGIAIERLWGSPTVCQASLHTLSHSFLKQPYKIDIVITILSMSTLSAERWRNWIRTTWLWNWKFGPWGHFESNPELFPLHLGG